MTAVATRGAARNRERSALGLNAIRVGIALLILLAWESLVRSGMVQSIAFVAGSDIIVALAQQLVSPVLWVAVWETSQSWLLGLLICLVVGAPLGAFLGSRPRIYATVRFTMEFLRATPPVVLIPFVLLLMGPTQEMKLVLVVLGAIWPLLVQAMYGMHDMDQVVVETARVYRFRRTLFVARVITPSIAPYILTGLRVSGVLALLLAIGGEMLTSAPGLGRQILYAQTTGAMATMYALIVIAGVIGMLFNAACSLLERRLLHWHPSQRGESR